MIITLTEKIIEWDKRVADVINDADYSIVNFESPIFDDEDVKIKKYGPNLHSSYDSLLPIKKWNCLVSQ